MIDIYGDCPECHKSWKGDPIPIDIRQHYHEPYYWSKLIHIELQDNYDGISIIQCPFCNTQWDRWTTQQIK